MNEKHVFIGLAVAAIALALALAPTLAAAVSAITSASITSTDSTLGARIQTASKIAKNGNDGAFGYGVLTSGDSLMVSTTHQGVLDSSSQAGDANSPVWHNHYVQLAGAGSYCAENTALGGARLEVAALTFESPGKVKVNQDVIALLNMPATFDGTNALTGNPITLSPGTTADTVVSFTLSPLFDGATLTHVCVENVQPASAS